MGYCSACTAKLSETPGVFTAHLDGCRIARARVERAERNNSASVAAIIAQGLGREPRLNKKGKR